MLKEAEESILPVREWLEDLSKEIEPSAQEKNGNSKTKRLKT